MTLSTTIPGTAADEAYIMPEPGRRTPTERGITGRQGNPDDRRRVER